MGFITKRYLKDFVCRYDKVVGIPYHQVSDFKGLKEEVYSFINSKGIEINYFYYYFDNYQEDKILLFLPGIGPGHVSYLKEIATFAERGYKVLTLDYTGCGYSKGACLASLNNPTSDVIDLLNLLNLKQEILLMGHSLGGYTALNVINYVKEIRRAVVISGFLDMKSLLNTFTHSNFITKHLLQYERKINPKYYPLDNINYLKNTKDDIFIIQSTDDNLAKYSIALEVVEPIKNPHIKKWKFTNKGHNPNYSDDAVKYMNEVFGKYYQLIKDKKIKTDEDRINYFKDVSLDKLVEQDEAVITKIVEFLNA